MSDDLDDYTKMYLTLKGDILALELLLKECRGSVVVSLENAVMCERHTDIEYFRGLLARVDNAIGEKK
jgi:hypothetical protein